jgi:hypothetical protein
LIWASPPALDTATFDAVLAVDSGGIEKSSLHQENRISRFELYEVTAVSMQKYQFVEPESYIDQCHDTSFSCPQWLQVL